MMDDAHTYAGRDLTRVSIYTPPGMTPPNVIEVTGTDGRPVEYVRLADSSLVCHSTPGYHPKTGKPQATGACRSVECHKRELGKCQCGRHESPVRVARAQ